MRIIRPEQRVQTIGNPGLRIEGALASAAPDVFTLTATTTASPQTVTIYRLAHTGTNTVIHWGDGSSNTYAPRTLSARTHSYATAGTYQIQVEQASAITHVGVLVPQISGLKTSQLRQSRLELFRLATMGSVPENRVHSADMTAWAPVNWWLYSMPAGDYRIHSTHMSAWRPAYFNLAQMPAGDYNIQTTHISAWRPVWWWLNAMPAGNYDIQSTHISAWRPDVWNLLEMPTGTYDIQTTHMSAWRPADWKLHSMPAGNYDIQTTHMSAWNPLYWHLHSMPAGTYGITSAADFAGWVRARTVSCYSLADSVNGKLLTADVDKILWGLYQAATARLLDIGTLLLDGTNEAPSGTFQAAASCPVTAATPGKEIAHELLNNGCGDINLGRVWATVTITE